MRVLIICAGEATRWGDFGGGPKHLVKLIGEPILHRSVRLIRELAPDADVRVVVRDSKDPRYKVPGARRAQARLTPENGDADKFLSSAHLWDTQGTTVVLYGDLFVTREAMASILTTTTDLPDGWWFHGRFDGSTITGHKGGECFAFTLHGPEGHDAFRAALERVSALYQAGTISRCGGWETYRALMGVPDDEILRFWPDGVSTHNLNLGHCTVVDDWTEDMDHPDDWHEWCWHYAHALAESRPT